MRGLSDGMLGLSRDVCCATCDPSEIEPSRSSVSVGCHRSPSDSRVHRIAQATGLADVRIWSGYIKCAQEDGITGLNNSDHCMVY